MWGKNTTTDGLSSRPRILAFTLNRSRHSQLDAVERDAKRAKTLGERFALALSDQRLPKVDGWIGVDPRPAHLGPFSANFLADAPLQMRQGARTVEMIPG